MIWFAIPDGHQMAHVLRHIEKAGIAFEGYEKGRLVGRPALRCVSDEARRLLPDPSRVRVKVIRPQDMPRHVATGAVDIGITGTDWWTEHRVQFPGSPVEVAARLGFGKVRIVAALSEDLPVRDVPSLKRYIRKLPPGRPLRIASEYAFIADHFARTSRLGQYVILMTYGATEALIPEDADVIVENTETGSTLRKNRLRIIETIMESEGCLVANAASAKAPGKGALIEALVRIFDIPR